MKIISTVSGMQSEKLILFTEILIFNSTSVYLGKKTKSYGGGGGGGIDSIE